ncbi:MAG: sporulation protein YqfD [Eubacterium sp.]|nr:sporulation protein YqfD [Eubacterium sp.]
MLKFIRWLTGFVEFAFWGGFNEGFINSCLEKSYNISDVRIENGARLPVGLIKKKVKTYTVQKKTLSDRELQSLASKQLENKLSSELDGCEIIKRKLTSSLNSDSITVKGYVICLENIGKR